jgi:hypothetical protein
MAVEADLAKDRDSTGFKDLENSADLIPWSTGDSQGRLDVRRNEIQVTILQSTSDTLLVAVPMIGLLFLGYFRLDELFGKPKKKPVQNRRQMSGWDQNGQPVCIDPDGTIQGTTSSSR